MNLFDAVSKELSSKKSLTENGALAYATSGKALVDFNFHLNIYRNGGVTEILNDWVKVYAEDPMLAYRYLFFVGDVREGAGERKIFRTCFAWLINAHPDVAKKLATLVPEYTRWDAVTEMLNTEIKETVVEMVKTQLAKDAEAMTAGKPISLLAKWMPSENTSSDATKKLAFEWRKALGMTSKQYRQMLSAMRKYSNVIEVAMSAKNWSEIDYEAVPSKANLKYNSAFLRNDETRRKAYLESLEKGEAKINASVANPDRIVAKYVNAYGWNARIKSYDAALEGMWKALPDNQTGDTLVVRDGSSSMLGNPLVVATALAVYTSEHNHGVWKDKFITFSSEPKIIDLSNLNTLHDKLERTYREYECSNTNLEATFNLILNAAINNHLSQEELPENVLVISDMQFDEARECYYGDTDSSKTLMETISNKFKAAGYTMPKLIFWNVAEKSSYKGTIPMQQNEAGVILLSGYSAQLMKLAMRGELDPYKALVAEISKPRYDAVEEVLKN